MTDLETFPGVSWIAQVQQPSGTWLSWQAFTTGSDDLRRRRARDLVNRLLANRRYEFIGGRVVRADWTVEEVIATNPEPDWDQLRRDGVAVPFDAPEEHEEG